MQTDWLRRVEYWSHCTLNLNVVLLDKIKQQHSNSVAGKKEIY